MSKLWQYRGHKIRPKDKNLIFNLIFDSFLLLILSGSVIVYQKNWRTIFKKQLTWQEIKGLAWSWQYLVYAIVGSLVLLGIVFLLLYHFHFDYLKQIQHRQKLAKMILQNKWYETVKVQQESFFKDLGNNKSKQKISHFPKVYYRLKDGLIHVQFEIVMSSYQDQLLHLEKKLESGLFCEIVDKILHDSFVEYTLLYDTIGNRITIDDVTCQNGELKLMETVSWQYDSLPHMLIAGGTGGGKTYFILTIIEALAKTNAKLTILDPKNADLADLAKVLPDVHYQKDDMLAALNDFYQDMMARNTEMKQMSNYKTGENYAYLGLPAHFLIFDEYVAFMDMLGRDSIDVMSKLKQIVMLGRQSGFFLILACQRPDAKYLGDGIRDQFMFRVALGRMSDLGYTMMFGETNKDFFQKPIKGRGYVDTGVGVISEFYTPLVPKDHQFL